MVDVCKFCLAITQLLSSLNEKAHNINIDTINYEHNYYHKYRKLCYKNIDTKMLSFVSFYPKIINKLKIKAILCNNFARASLFSIYNNETFESDYYKNCM